MWGQEKPISQKFDGKSRHSWWQAGGAGWFCKLVYSKIQAHNGHLSSKNHTINKKRQHFGSKKNKNGTQAYQIEELLTKIRNSAATMWIRQLVETPFPLCKQPFFNPTRLARSSLHLSCGAKFDKPHKAWRLMFIIVEIWLISKKKEIMYILMMMTEKQI